MRQHIAVTSINKRAEHPADQPDREAHRVDHNIARRRRFCGCLHRFTDRPVGRVDRVDARSTGPRMVVEQPTESAKVSKSPSRTFHRPPAGGTATSKSRVRRGPFSSPGSPPLQQQLRSARLSWYRRKSELFRSFSDFLERAAWKQPTELPSPIASPDALPQRFVVLCCPRPCLRLLPPLRLLRPYLPGPGQQIRSLVPVDRVLYGDVFVHDPIVRRA